MAVGATQPPDAAIVERRPVVFSDAGDAIELETNVFVREALLEGNVVEGPAIIEQLDSTTLVSPGLSAQVGAGGGIIIDCDTSEQQEEQR